ncbi:MAG: 5-(carboxyamino)imidazole ribonucleotide mutase [Candidatus Marinimicrobia bacterium]|nr:5-(carboxyamino)imidazole ribonucleotide mutase [Candidatus Neomarinimicrobiota bacterium]MBL7022720.1 5-(carboxyamino)imidazole ribonucleotide mutase [Candidatus Neomarinimicrobiota bacterium]MBL7109151.1 5-(carboxyamino)imidazole ribonucleotide mutase [Candidatus Neomarinimicrobiota bacterium]
MNKIAVLIGSESDRKTIEASTPYFEYFGLDWELKVLSAHRNPKEVEEFAINARDNGYAILVGAAGMAAHLAGALKASSTLPIIGIPLPGGMMDGLDSLLSTVQMPKGVPVATMSVGKAGAINAAIFCAEILSITDEEIAEKLLQFKGNGCKL